MRRSEMVELKMSDIDFKKMEIKIRSDRSYTSKGKRPRTIPLSHQLAKILKQTNVLKDSWALPRSKKEGVTIKYHRPQELSLAYQR